MRDVSLLRQLPWLGWQSIRLRSYISLFDYLAIDEPVMMVLVRHMTLLKIEMLMSW